MYAHGGVTTRKANAAANSADATVPFYGDTIVFQNPQENE